jgi:hypothetical protein
MKARYVSLLLLVLTCNARSYSQPDKDTIIKNIRQVFQQINGDKTLRTITLAEPEFLGKEVALDGGAELKGYFKNDTLCRMVLEFGLSYAMRKYDYYFSKGRVIFIYERELDYPEKKDGMLDYEKLVPAFEGRYYYDNNKLIRTYFKGKKRAEGNTPAQYVKDLPVDVKKYIRLLQAHAKNKK